MRSVEITERLAHPSDAFCLEATDRDGELKAVRSAAEEGGVAWSTAVDDGQPLRVSAKANRDLDGFAEEGRRAVAFVKALNAARGTDYALQEKRDEDYEFADRMVVSVSNPTDVILLQLRHLDDEMVKHIGQRRVFEGKRTTDELAAMIQTAIEAKSLVDTATKARTYLVLLVPVGLTGIYRAALQQCDFDPHGYIGVWVSPSREEPFPLRTQGS
jgi:hypothetical protein